jgi:hypothetical protein
MSGCAGGIGCQGGRHPTPTPAGPSARGAPFSTSFSARNWIFHLRQLAPNSTDDEAKAAEVWSDLFAGMAEDAKTRHLLTQLHGGRPVELVVLPGEKAGDDAVLTAPPPDGYDFVMRLADLGHTRQSGGDLVRLIAYGHVILIKDSEAPVVSGLEDVAKGYEKLPLPGEPLSLAMEDYVFRHAPGWAVISGPYFREESLPRGVEEQRRDLDRRISDYASHARAYYGAPRRGR